MKKDLIPIAKSPTEIGLLELLYKVV